MRGIFEAMGAEVNWDAATQTVTAIKDAITVILQVDSLTATINNENKSLDTPAKIIDSRILAPLRFVGEVFGGAVQWDETTRVVDITTD
jgi:N-acetylmuramoyl-L-alanine amidase